MHQNALRDMQIALDEKHNFSVTCPDVLFMGSEPDPPKYEK
jgi:hypothetical protein